uniref:Solute carrier family 25 member 44 n=1 Tax=Strigamia maritima TaxID=126957 RepID=T1J0N7_STRMM
MIYNEELKLVASLISTKNHRQNLKMEPIDPPYIRTIEWDMMNKKRFYPLSILSSFTIRCVLYPFTVIKTRLQVQKRNTIYKGTYDAFTKIFRHEGFAGLYKGFWINTIQIFSGVFYVTTYENVRRIAQIYGGIEDSRLRGMIGGGAASVVGQTIIVPFDVISQHMMILGQYESVQPNQVNKPPLRLNPLNIKYEKLNKASIARQIIIEIYKRDGFTGFYRGYLASLGTFVPNSALWWSFYLFYSDELVKRFPDRVPLLMIQCMAAPLGGITTSLITNPLDVVRARIQVHRLHSFSTAFQTLWAEEGLRIFTKGLSARLVQSIAFSFMIILGYESIKRFSINDEYKDQIKW